jgi:signal transduction histidine kinase
VRPFVDDAIDEMQMLAAHGSLHLRSELGSDLPTVLADPGHLQRVFTNLLGNAIKFTPTGGTITVRAEAAGSVVLFSVTDTGSGISAEEIPHLFDRFWQARTTARQGTGLGLTIVRGIVMAHGGQIWVESQLQKGTTVFFTLPVATGDADESTGRQRAPSEPVLPDDP